MRPNTKIDPYKVLEVPKEASQEDIKKQFRNLSKKYHPDVHTSAEDKKVNEEKFKQINEAYEILSDPQKRAAIDNPIPQGMPFNPFGQGGNIHFNFNGPGGFNINELFNDFVHGGHQTRSTTQIVSINISIDLLKAIEGGEVVTDTQFGTIKFNLPPATQPGTQLRIKLKKEGNNEVIIQCRIDVVIPTLTKEKLDKLKDVMDVQKTT